MPATAAEILEGIEHYIAGDPDRTRNVAVMALYKIAGLPRRLVAALTGVPENSVPFVVGQTTEAIRNAIHKVQSTEGQTTNA